MTSQAQLSNFVPGNGGFTLAEVLITLGIIGIVAALTIPSMMSNYKKKQTAVQLKKAYSDISQALKLSEVSNGEFKNWEYTVETNEQSTLDFMNKYIVPYVKNIKHCDSGKSRKCGMSVSSSGQNYIFNNGVGFSILAGINIPILIDLNGPKKPNIIGQDVFYFNINEKGQLIPYFWKENITRDEIINGITSNNMTFYCKTPPGPLEDKDGNRIPENAYYLYMCGALIMYDGWEISDDYPVKF